MKISNRLSKNKFLFITLVILSTFGSCNKKKELYHCPMHTSYTSDRPGTCPICNMDLVKVENHEEHQKEEDHSQQKNIQEPIAKSEEGGTGFELSFDKQQSIGIKTDVVTHRDLTKKINLYSSVAYDPELYNALLEYKQAIQTSALLPESSSGLGIQNLQLRLKQLGLSSDQIRTWTSGKRDPSELIIGGKAGRAHIYSQVYESELAMVKSGMKIRFKTDVYPDLEFVGIVKSIDNIVDKSSRTLRLRSEVSDPKGLLKPQMFGDALVEVSLPKLFCIPSSAIIDTGVRKIVYVQLDQNTFRAVEVKIGGTVDNWSEVLSGLEEGQRVVVESTFLIDSEAKIRFGNNAHKH